MDITLAIFLENCKSHRSLSKHANIHINRTTHYEITTLYKNEKFVLLCYFNSIKHRLDQLNNKRTKIAINSIILFFESCYQEKCLLKAWSFLAQPSQNDGPVKIFAKLNHLLVVILFSTSRISDIGLNENAWYDQNLICQ